MLGLITGSSYNDSFNGLADLKDFGSKKNDWLHKSPDLNESTIKLLESTKLLANKNNNLQVIRASYSRKEKIRFCLILLQEQTDRMLLKLV